MPRKISEVQKEEMVKRFFDGLSLEELSKLFNFSKATISRYLKKSIGEDKYRELTKKNQDLKKLKSVKENHDFRVSFEEESLKKESFFTNSEFFEIVPLENSIQSEIQKDLASIPISEIIFPKVVYMIVDKNIELNVKNLKDFPDWQFLSQEELNRKTIEIHADIKIAKRYCNKAQKVIKVPNTNVFKIVAPLLIAKGISRIVSKDRLISL